MFKDATEATKHFLEFDTHKAVYQFEDASVGLKGFIAIHNDNLGSAVGGTRMFPYASEKDALTDVLRLSRAMTYKCALAGVQHGGGKAVIIGNPDHDKSEKLLRAYAKIIDSLRGAFSTGEDVGISEDDVQIMLQESKHFIGRRGVAGDPSPYAALSAFDAMQVAAEGVWGTENLFSRKIGIKGVGKVGGELLRLLAGVGAGVTISDIKPSTVASLKEKFPQVKVVGSNTIHAEQVDIFSPCALGNDITAENINAIKAKVICGGANNQLLNHELGDELFKRGIVYVPDYVANAGGLINVVDELEEGGYNRKRVLERIENIKHTLRTINLFAKQKKESPHRIADKLAENIFLNGTTVV